MTMMMKTAQFLSIFVLVTLAACASRPTQEPLLPTLAVLPSLTTTPTVPTATVTETPMSQSVLFDLTALVPTPTLTPTPTITFTPSNTPIWIALPPTPLDATPLSGDVNVNILLNRLWRTPLFHNMTTAQVGEIFRRGQTLGNAANIFTTVGDSNTTNGDFMQPIGMSRNYCEWGSYAYLRETVDFFSVPPGPLSANSFTHHSAAAEMGFNTAVVLDPFWADPAECERNQSPLVCEYQRVKPSVAVIMLGGIDIKDLDAAAYRRNMTQIIEQSIQQGVIPLLTTFVVLPDRDVWQKSLAFNEALLDIAETYQTPLINLWMAAQSLPNYGIGPDRTHLKAAVGSFCSFTGAEQRLGGTLRNLLTLQALDLLRREVLTVSSG